MRLKTRHQEKLALALAAVAATVLFELWPRLDIAVSMSFFDGRSFIGNQWGWAQLIYHGVPRLGSWLVILAVLIALMPLVPRGRRWVKPWLQRRALASLVVVALGVGVLVHNGLKDSWGRPRPADVQVFGGTKIYQAPLQHSEQCERNCSFVSGHAAAGFALIGLGLFGSRRTRWRWWAIGAVAGSVIGLARIVQGRHFFGDIVFCMLALWLVCVLLRAIWLRLALARRALRRRQQRSSLASTT
jgi:lipid A 4'-phosphatase